MQDGGGGSKRDGVALPRNVQEHLGRKLRSELQVETERRPAFLGETNVPPQFEPLVRKLEAGERGERQGYEAVKQALIADPPRATATGPAPLPPSEPVRRPKIAKRPD